MLRGASQPQLMCVLRTGEDWKKGQLKDELFLISGLPKGSKQMVILKRHKKLFMTRKVVYDEIFSCDLLYLA